MSTLDLSTITKDDPSSTFEEDAVKQAKELKDEVCDYFFCKCHHFLDVRWVVLCHSMAVFTQSMFISGFVAGSMTTIEHQYELSSREIGTISVMYDTGQLLLLLPVSHMGSGNWRKMRIESVGLFVMVVAATMYASPHLATEKAELKPGTLFCNATSISEKNACSGEVRMETLRQWRWIFWFSALLFGMGASPLFSVGTTYVDDNSPQNKGYFYFAVIISNIFLGAAFGSILVGQFLDISVDINVPEPLQRMHSAQLGAWWIGPLVTAAACFVILIPLAGFPLHMPQFFELQQQRLKDRIVSKVVPRRTFVESMHMILKNSILLFLCVSVACEMMFFTGLVYFGPKYMERTFSVSKSKAPMIVGGSTVAAGVSGVLVGGWITRQGNFGLKGNLVMLVIMSLLNLFPASAFLMNCEARQVQAKITACNIDCRCSDSALTTQIGCGADNQNYISPCYAGCRTFNASGYFDCRCIEARSKRKPQWISGYCAAQCDVMMPVFVFIMCMEIFGTCVMSSPGINAVLRCVDEELRTIALGLAGVFSRLFGSIPGPLIFAHLIDASCEAWNNVCGTSGYCKYYHRSLLRRYFLAIILTCKCISLACLCGALLSYYLHRSSSLPRKVEAVTVST